MKKMSIGTDLNIRNMLWYIIYSIIVISYCFLYSLFVICVCYNLILYYRFTVSNIMYIFNNNKKKKKWNIFTPHIFITAP